MGRMLETLKLGDTRKATAPVSGPGDASPVVDCVVDWEIGAEVPFVEVGAPGKKMELSASLMQHPPQPTPQPPHLAVEPTPTPTPVARLTPVEPMKAAFEPWPASAAFAFGPEIVAYHHPEHPVSREYVALLDALLDNVTMAGPRVLLLAGGWSNVGTSTVLLNLAVCAARMRKLRTLVVETKAGDPKIRTSGGFGAVLNGSLALEQAVVQTGLPLLDLLSAGTGTTMPMEAVSWLANWLRSRYELILIDGAGKNDSAVTNLLTHADGVYLVLPQGESAAAHQDFVRGVATAGGRLRGLIHTRVDV